MDNKTKHCGKSVMRLIVYSLPLYTVRMHLIELNSGGGSFESKT